MNKNFYLSIFSGLGLFLTTSACTPKKVPTNNAGPIRILSYSSLGGDGSLGAELEKLSALGKSFKVIPTANDANLVSVVKSQKLRDLRDYDFVWGLDASQYQEALAQSWVAPGFQVALSPFAIIVDTQKVPRPEWPKSWREIPQKWKNELFIQDPRLSSVGIGFLRAIFEFSLLSKEEAQGFVKRSFPSWSPSYESFTQGHARMIWSYQSSEAYHRCQENTDRYQALPLAEGYPIQEEWVAPLPHTSPELRDAVQKLLLSDSFQKQIPLKNWMFPAQTQTVLPDCFQKLPPLKFLIERSAPSSQKMREWLDLWSL